MNVYFFVNSRATLPPPPPSPTTGDFHKSALEFSKLVNLEVLDLGHNKLRGRVPPELGMAERLQALLLNDNFLTGPVPEFLAQMPR